MAEYIVMYFQLKLVIMVYLITETNIGCFLNNEHMQCLSDTDSAILWQLTKLPSSYDKSLPKVFTRYISEVLSKRTVLHVAYMRRGGMKCIWNCVWKN
jgi:hypothetical protein